MVAAIQILNVGGLRSLRKRSRIMVVGHSTTTVIQNGEPNPKRNTGGNMSRSFCYTRLVQRGYKAS